MNTTEATPSNPARDPRRAWRLGLAAMIPVGPLGILLVRGVLPYWTHEDTATVVAKTLDQPGRMEVVLWTELVWYPAMLLGVLALGYVARRGAPVLATVGAAASFLGYAWWPLGWGTGDLAVHSLGRSGYDAAAVEAVVAAGQAHPLSAVTGFGWVVGHILGLVVLAAALRRARIVSLPVAALLAASQPIHLVAAVLVPSRLLDVTAGWGLTTVGFAMVSVALLRMSDDEFDPPVTTHPHLRLRSSRTSSRPIRSAQPRKASLMTSHSKSLRVIVAGVAATAFVSVVPPLGTAHALRPHDDGSAVDRFVTCHARSTNAARVLASAEEWAQLCPDELPRARPALAPVVHRGDALPQRLVSSCLSPMDDGQFHSADVLQGWGARCRAGLDR